MTSLEQLTGLVKFYTDDNWQHVIINDQSVCEGCKEKSCLNVCPTAVFQWDHQPGNPVLVYYKQCIECGACRLACYKDNVAFSYPRGGFGVNFREG